MWYKHELYPIKMLSNKVMVCRECDGQGCKTCVTGFLKITEGFAYPISIRGDYETFEKYTRQRDLYLCTSAIDGSHYMVYVGTKLGDSLIWTLGEVYVHIMGIVPFWLALELRGSAGFEHLSGKTREDVVFKAIQALKTFDLFIKSQVESLERTLNLPIFIGSFDEYKELSVIYQTLTSTMKTVLLSQNFIEHGATLNALAKRGIYERHAGSAYKITALGKKVFQFVEWKNKLATAPKS